MMYGKEECKKMVAGKAAVIVHDTYTESGVPVFAVCSVVDCGGLKSGRDSRWFVKLDRVFSDGCDCIMHDYLLGVNYGNMMDVAKLAAFVNQRFSYLPVHERQMIIAETITKLKEAKR